MGDNKTKRQASKPGGLPEKLVQGLAWVALIVLFVLDKLLQKIVPPLHEGFYAALFGVAAFGRGIRDFFDIFRK